MVFETSCQWKLYSNGVQYLYLRGCGMERFSNSFSAIVYWSVELKGRKVLLFTNMELFEDGTESLSIDKLGIVVYFNHLQGLCHAKTMPRNNVSGETILLVFLSLHFHHLISTLTSLNAF